MLQVFILQIVSDRKESNGRNWPSTLKLKSKRLFQAEMPTEPFFERSREMARQGKLKGDLDCLTLVMVYEMPRKSLGLQRIES